MSIRAARVDSNNEERVRKEIVLRSVGRVHYACEMQRPSQC
jgi:hypothetical protein